MRALAVLVPLHDARSVHLAQIAQQCSMLESSTNTNAIAVTVATGAGDSHCTTKTIRAVVIRAVHYRSTHYAGSTNNAMILIYNRRTMCMHAVSRRRRLLCLVFAAYNSYKLLSLHSMMFHCCHNGYW
jgi:hypothetical protein